MVSSWWLHGRWVKILNRLAQEQFPGQVVETLEQASSRRHISVVPLLKAVQRLRLLFSLLPGLMNWKDLPLPQALYHVLPCWSSKPVQQTITVNHLKQRNKVLFLVYYVRHCAQWQKADIKQMFEKVSKMVTLNPWILLRRVNIIEFTLHWTDHVTRTRKINRGPRV